MLCLFCKRAYRGTKPEEHAELGAGGQNENSQNLGGQWCEGVEAVRGVHV